MTNLISSAYFTENTNQNSNDINFECFSKLKNIANVCFCALFYKGAKKYEPNYKISFLKEFNDYTPSLYKKENGIFKFRVPLFIQGAIAGYFLVIKKEPFKKAEKEKIKQICFEYTDKIKDFEISKIFKNQLNILQGAILEKNRVAKLLEEQNEKLIETDKIRSEFLANISHELRTPLNSIIGFSTALKDEMPGPMNEKQKSYANKILSSAIHLTGLINDILDMTKIESKAMKLNIQKHCPTDIIKEVINIIEPLAKEKNIKIETDFKYEETISVDFIKFRQIMYNLIGNAIKFSHQNSKIKISTSSFKNTATIKVRDFGIGIAKKDLKRIFDKFVQLDNIYTKKYSSTGLGLTITKELVKLHNADISVRSEINKGSEFILKFKKEPF